MARHFAAKASDIPEGGRKAVTVAGRPVAIFNIKGEYFAFHSRCPHQGGDLCAGVLIGLVEADKPGSYNVSKQGEILRCPWHGWEFDIRTGLSQCRPKDFALKRYNLVLEKPEAEERQLSLEKYPVHLSDENILVDI